MYFSTKVCLRLHVFSLKFLNETKLMFRICSQITQSLPDRLNSCLFEVQYVCNRRAKALILKISVVGSICLVFTQPPNILQSCEALFYLIPTRHSNASVLAETNTPLVCQV